MRDRRDRKRDDEEMQMQLVSEMVNGIESPNWKELMKENGVIDRYVKMVKKDKDIKPTQLRKFFQEVKKLKTTIKDKGWDKMEADIYQLIPRVKYAQGRNLLPKSMVAFIVKSVETIGNSDDKKTSIENFVKIFEAIIAFHKSTVGKEER